MPQTLAQPTFVTGPNDSLAVVDAYTQRSTTVINNTPDRLSQANLGSVASLFGGKSMLSSLPLGGASGLISSALNSVTGRLGITNDKLAKAVASLTPIATKAIMDKLPTAKINSMIATVGSVERVIDMAKTGNVTSILGSVNSLAASAGIPGIKLSDPNGYLALGQGLAQQGISNGIPGVLTTLKNSGIIKGVPAMNSVVNSIMPTLTKKGDVLTLKEITTTAPESIPSISDSALYDLCKYYPDPTSPKSIAQYQSDFGDIKSTFSAVKPSWLSTQVNGETVTDLSCLTTASPEMRKTISLGAITSDDPNDKWLLLSTGISEEEKKANDEIKIEYTSKFTPYTEQQQIDVYQKWLKNQSTPQDQTNSLYPSVATMTAKTVVDVDPRMSSEVSSVNVALSGQKTPTPTVRSPALIRSDMDAVMDQWTAELKARYDPAVALLNSMLQPGSDATPADIASQKTFVAGIKALVDEKYNDKYYDLSMELKRTQAVYDSATIT